jgi:hypothetical protein
VEYVAAQYFYEPISAPKTATATTSPSLDQRTWHRSNTHYRNSFQIQKALNCDDAKVNGIEFIVSGTTCGEASRVSCTLGVL